MSNGSTLPDNLTMVCSPLSDYPPDHRFPLRDCCSGRWNCISVRESYSIRGNTLQVTEILGNRPPSLEGLYTVHPNFAICSGSEWRDLRAAWQPMFFTGSLENYMPIFDRAATLLTEELSWAAVKNQFVGVQSAVSNMALNVICQAAFG